MPREYRAPLIGLLQLADLMTTRTLLAFLLSSSCLLAPFRIGFGQDDQSADWENVSVGEKLFALTVEPVLRSKCAACHGQDDEKVESGLVITALDLMLSGGDSGETVLVPGKRSESWLYLSATWEHDELQMPPKENDRLSADDLEALGQWIDEGAPWPAPERMEAIRKQFATGVVVATSGGLDRNWDERRYAPDTLWAYQPLAYARPPEPTGLPAHNAVDLFLNAELSKLGLRPSSMAPRETLIRRLFFDLTGLPPSPAQVRAFINDPRPNVEAWEQLVDQMLASPQFGEQWARHWLDTIRYADSAGFANDFERPNAWRYRDYVVRQINADYPVDQFIREQLAGDEIDAQDPEKLIATGMLRMGPWEHTGMSVDRETRQLFLDDVTDIVGQAFLAHPLQCARCHDHKFDPIPTRDYYRIQAAFATTQFAEREAGFLESENQSDFDQQEKYLQARIQYFQAILEQLNAKEMAAAKAWYAERGWSYANRQQKLRKGVPEAEIAPRKIGFAAEDFGLERIARKYLERHRWELDRYKPIAYSVYAGPTPVRKSAMSRLTMPAELEKSGTVEQTAILSGGDVFSPTLTVQPGVFSALVGIAHADVSHSLISKVREESGITQTTSGRRLAFAKWLTNPNQNWLTPRVMANRLWQHHFGKGLVTTPNNFGTAGAKPTHPALLDYLALELVNSGWSAKHLHRLILTSRAYTRDTRYKNTDDMTSEQQQQLLAERDPLGTSYATFEARRLSAEELRDALLAISGLLHSEMGGPPTRPDINSEVASQPRQIMGTYAPIYQPSPNPEDRNRRTLYALRLRGLRDPMLEVFNQPSPDLSCEMRDSSTVAPQALTLFNSPLSYNRALAMAERLLAENHDSDSELIAAAFELAFGRSAAPEEVTWCIDHWRAMTRRHEAIKLEDVQPPHEVTRTFVDENTGEQFTFTEPLEQNRDYVPEVWPSKADPRARGLADVCLVLLSSNELLYVP